MIRPLKKLSQVHSINQKAFGACERIYQILEQPSTIKDKPSCISIKEFKDEIIFEDVYFKYKEGDWVMIPPYKGQAKIKQVNIETKI